VSGRTARRQRQGEQIARDLAFVRDTVNGRSPQEQRVIDQFQRQRQAIDVWLYLQNPRGFGTTETAIEEALTRKRNERQAQNGRG
jgi:hypothetical protein